MKRIINMIVGSSCISALLLFSGCKGEQKDNPQQHKESLVTEAKIHIVSRLKAETLIKSESDFSAINTYLKIGLDGGKKASVLILDRSDRSGVAKGAVLALNTYKFSAFSLYKQTGKTAFEGSLVYFNVPIPAFKASKIGTSYFSYSNAQVAGDIIKKDASGNITSKKTVQIPVLVGICRFDNEDQIKAFFEDKILIGNLKEALIVGTVSKDKIASLQTAVETNNAFVIKSAAQGADYELFFMAAKKKWSLSKVLKTDLSAAGISTYELNFSWN